MHSTRKLLLAAVVFAGATSIARAQMAAMPQPENVVQLSSNATVEVPQDLLAITLQAVREGTDPAKVQSELKTALDAALAQARRDAKPGALDVRTGNFSVLPRYSRDQRITGWVGTGTVVLEGTDIPRVSQAAGRLAGLNVVGSGFRLSRPARDKAEQEAQGEAIAAFRAKAGELARSFGFSSYSLREVSVNAQDSGPVRPMMAMARAKGDMEAADPSPVPVEAGKANVIVNVSGSVQLR
jgi:predicted secreted protein